MWEAWQAGISYVPADFDVLKKCPFCDGDGRKEFDKENDVWYIHCRSCGADGGWCRTKDGAINHWNRRVNMYNQALDDVLDLF